MGLSDEQFVGELLGFGLGPYTAEQQARIAEVIRRATDPEYNAAVLAERREADHRRR